ncbi:MAG: hypothetical protein KC620_26340, partial [Myxococcales bacterium]|nr:hypothetical protein [Myxococcales bacterium]
PEIAWQRALVLLDLKREREARAAFGEYLAVAAGRPEEAKRIAEAQARLAGAVPAPAPPPEAAPPAPSGGP